MRLRHFILFVIITSCGSNKTELSGKYVRDKEQSQIKINLDKLEMPEIGLIDELYFGERFCRYNLKGIKQSARYWIEDGYVHIGTSSATNFTLKIIDRRTLEGEGFVYGVFRREEK